MQSVRRLDNREVFRQGGGMISRRRFLLATTAALLTGSRARAAEPFWPVVTFTKPFQRATYARTAEIVGEVGWQGIELPLRAKGQIEPERVEEELPKMVEALKARGLMVGTITTDIVAVSTAHAEKVLRTAKALGITRYRLGSFRYRDDEHPGAQLDALKPQLRELAALNQQLGVRGGIQNHSGERYIGCAVWDIFELVRDLDPQALGICFDIGHATLEGGLSWKLAARLMEPWMVCVYVKDFRWEREAQGFAPKWGPLGEGMVRREFFDWLRKSSYRGPISQHCEYLNGDTPENLAAMKKDWAVLRGWVS
jgi:sugar phosphate isomerase/epimerase